MTTTIAAIKAYVGKYDSDPLEFQNLDNAVEVICNSPEFKNLLLALINTPAFSQTLGQEFAAAGAIAGIAACRSLRSCLNLSLSRFFGLWAELVMSLDLAAGAEWYAFANKMHQSNIGGNKLIDRLLKGDNADFYRELVETLVRDNPHAIYPTSSYRESQGFVESTDDATTIEAVLHSRTFTSVKLLSNALDPEQTILRDLYIPLGRCVCLIDQNVEAHFGEQLENYFSYHGIHLDKLVYRAMEVDKGISTVEIGRAHV